MLDLHVPAPVAEAGGIPQGSPPRQAGEDRGTPREGAERRDGGLSPSPEEQAAREQTEERVQADEGRGADVAEQRRES